MKKYTVLYFFIYCSAYSLFGQTFTGPEEVCYNVEYTYTYDDDVNYSTVTWSVTSGGTIVSGTGLSRKIKWTADGSVTVKLKNSSGLVVSQDTKYVYVFKSGTISAPAEICSGSSVTISSSGYYGTSFNWEYSPDGSTWYALTTAGPSISHTPSATTWYRSWICKRVAANISNVISVSASPQTVAGTLTITSASSFCSTGTASFSLSGHTGIVTNWYVRYQEGSGSWSGWSSYSTTNGSTNSYGVSASATQTRNYEFYTVVKSGSCAAANTNTVSITVSPATVSGTLSVSSSQVCNSQSVTLSVSGNVGTINSYQVRSKIGASGTWSSWSGTSNTPTVAPNGSDYVTYEFQALVQSGMCSQLSTNIVSAVAYPVSAAGTLAISQTTACSSATPTISLSGNVGSTTTWYTRWTDNPGTWSSWSKYGTVNTTSNQYSVATNGSVSRTYEFYTVVQSGVCAAVNTNIVSITVSPATVAGTLSVSSSEVCKSQTVTLSLSGYVGTVDDYQVRTKIGSSGTWSSWSSTTTTPTISASNSNYVAHEFKALVKSGVCSQLESNVVTSTAYPATVGGSLASNVSSVCSSATITLTLNGNTGSVTHWWSRYRDGAGTWTAWTAYSADNVISKNYNVASGSTLDRTYEFYNTVQSGVCAAASSSITSVTVYPSSIGGSLTPEITEHYTSVNSGTISLSGHIGAVQRWEKDTGIGWSAISNTSNSQTYSNLLQSTSYRTVVKSGVCNEAYSTIAVVNIYPSPEITYSQEYIPYGGSTELSTTASYSSYQWYRNEQAISGATSRNYTTSEPGTFKVEVIASGATTQGQSADVQIKSTLSATGSNLRSITAILTEGITSTTNLHTLSANQLQQAIDYHDGLGRTFQVVAVAQSPSGMDVVNPTGYSSRGLIETSYLPYAASVKDGLVKTNAIRGADLTYATSEQFTFYQTAPGIAHDEYPYAAKVLAATPLATLKEQGAPGLDWQPGNGHTVKNDLVLNIAGEVRYWKPDGTTETAYAANSLYVNQTTNENGHKTRIFTDKIGRTVLKQVQLDETIEGIVTAWLETYYIYDDYGRLIYQVPPKAMAVLGTGSFLDVNNSAVTELVFKYTYDSKGRLVEKKAPGSGVEYTVYDNLDRVVLTQDANLRIQGKWNFIKYDERERAVYSGLYANSGDRLTVQGLFDARNYDTEPWFEKEEINAAYHGYSSTVFPTTGLTVMRVNYYDHYDFDRNGTPDYTYDNTHFSGQEPSASTHTRGLATGSRRVIINSDGVTGNWLTGVLFYDRFDRIIQVQSNNPLYLTVADKQTIIYDFVKMLKSKTTHSSSATVSLDLTDRMDYDHAGRVTRIYRQINSDPEQVIAEYTYNELGQLAGKNIHKKTDNSWLQTVDLTYNIRGWLKKINDPGTIGNDFFAMELNYNDNLGSLGHAPAWNGNITATRWKENFGNGATDEIKAYAYTYSKNNQLKGSKYGAGSLFSEQPDRFNEHGISYDANGNIKTMQRNGLSAAGATTTIDNLSYTYAADNQNRLVQVEDGTSNAQGFENGATVSGEYDYDMNGNASKDDNKGISSIAYNELNKIKQVDFTDGRAVKYTYDASGSKLKMEAYAGGALSKTTTYSGGFVYEDGALSFFSSPEGRVVVDGESYEYQYALTDHQGNTRTVFTSNEETLDFRATFETAASGLREDTDLFENTAGANEVSSLAANTTEGGSRAVRLNNEHHAGPGMMLKVFPGDKIDAQVYAYHENGSGYDTSASLSTMITAIATAFGGVSGGAGESGAIYDAFEEALTVVGLGGNQGDTIPSVWLNYIFFDENEGFDWVNQDDNAGWERVPASAFMNKTKMHLDIPVIKKPGLLYIYLSYENESTNWVYFDDLQVTYKKSQVVQNNNYYAFGMQTQDSWTRADTQPNQYLYNAGSELNESTGWYETFFRGYDAALGRFLGVDVMADGYADMSPYNYAMNDPAYWNDPLGDCVTCYQHADPGYLIRTDDTPYAAPSYTQGKFSGYGSMKNYFHQTRNDNWVHNYDPWAWTGMDVYGAGPEQFGANFLPSIYYGSARLAMEYDIYEVWIDYYVRENGSFIDSEFKGYRYEKSSRSIRLGQAQQGNDPPGDGRGSAMSFSFGFAAIFGISGEWGIVTDETGASKSYYTVSANFGLGVDLGLNYKEIIPTNGKSFRVDHYQGRGKNLSSGILFTSEGRGGNTTGNPNLNPFDFGITYKERSISGSPLMGTFLPVGLTDVGWIYQMSNTNFYK